jgi:hypothetical protein
LAASHAAPWAHRTECRVPRVGGVEYGAVGPQNETPHHRPTFRGLEAPYAMR